MGKPIAGITCVGLGLMGSALAGALLSAGSVVTVWNRSFGRAEALIRRGARGAQTFAEARSAGPVLLICIDNYASTHAPDQGIRGGLIVWGKARD